MKLLKSKSRRSLASIFTFLLGSYDINAGTRQPETITNRPATLLVPAHPEQVLAILFTRLDTTHLSELSQGNTEVKLKEDEINQLRKDTGIENEEINDGIKLANLLRSYGDRKQVDIESKAKDMIGNKCYKTLEHFYSNSSFDDLIKFLVNNYQIKSSNGVSLNYFQII